MKSNHIFCAILVLSTHSCNLTKTETITKFDIEKFDKYSRDLKTEYNKSLLLAEKKERTIDFIKWYFEDDSLYKKYTYSIKYNSEGFKLINGIYQSVFYNEVIYFEKPNNIDSVIKYIKGSNKLGPYNLKVNRIYKIGNNTIICVNYFGFNISNYEDFLMDEFRQPLTVEIINTR